MLRWLEVIALTALAAFLFGYVEGRASFRGVVAVAQQKQMAAADLASTKEAERLAAEAKTADLAQQLEDAANAQVSTSICLSVDRILRLNQR
jgi:cell division protein FtsB